MIKPKVSVGISAYNEEHNLAQLLRSITRGKAQSFELAEIIVVSDGSTDRTAEIARSLGDERLKLIEFPRREGKNSALNTITAQATGDFLVLIDADSLPRNDDYLAEMVGPLIANPDVGMVGSEVLPMPAQTTLERVINHGHALKREMFRSWKNGQNIFECHGRSRAFSKKLYKRIVLPFDCVEDAYSYLFAVHNRSPFRFVSQTAVYFRAPQTLRDYIRQSSRFLQSGKTLEKHFGADLVRDEYALPRSLIMRATAKEFFRYPVLTLEYIGLHLLSRVAAKFVTFDQSFIKPSPSSKKLIAVN